MQKVIVVSIVILGVCAGVFVLSNAREQLEASCQMCPTTYVSAEEIQAFLEHGGLDQGMRNVDAGKINVPVAIIHRGRLVEPGNVAEHSLVTEVYYIISGSGTHRTGPDLIDKQPRPADHYAVRLLNGPGHNATDIRNPEEQQLKTGDVLIIPAGTGHQFIRIDDHITYLTVRVDPDKVVPLMTEADAKAYLSGSGPWAR